MNIKQSAVIVGSLALVMGAGMASAAFEEGTEGERRQGPPQEVREAIENNDYAAWQEAVSEKGPFVDNTSEAVFDTVVEIHTLREAGDTGGAKALRQSLSEDYGIEFRKRGKRLHGSQEAREALQAGDFAAWQAAVEEAGKGPFVGNTTEAVFDTLQEVHTLREAGDKEGAKALKQGLADDVGIEFKKRGPRGSGGGCEAPQA